MINRNEIKKSIGLAMALFHNSNGLIEHYWFRGLVVFLSLPSCTVTWVSHRKSERWRGTLPKRINNTPTQITHLGVSPGIEIGNWETTWPDTEVHSNVLTIPLLVNHIKYTFDAYGLLQYGLNVFVNIWIQNVLYQCRTCPDNWFW